MTQLIEIIDQQFIRKATQLAKRKKVKDINLYIQQLVIKAARAAVGLDADLSPGEVASQLNCHLNTVKAYHKDGKFPNAYYRSARCLRIPQKDVTALKERTAKLAA